MVKIVPFLYPPIRLSDSIIPLTSVTSTSLMNSPLREQVSNYENYLKLEMGDANPRTLTDEDYDMLIHSNCLFARKFSDANISLVDKITRSYPCYFLVL